MRPTENRWYRGMAEGERLRSNTLRSEGTGFPPRMRPPLPEVRFDVRTQGGSPVRVARSPGSVRGAPSNHRPYRDALSVSVNCHVARCGSRDSIGIPRK